MKLQLIVSKQEIQGTEDRVLTYSFVGGVSEVFWCWPATRTDLAFRRSLFRATQRLSSDVTLVAAQV